MIKNAVPFTIEEKNKYYEAGCWKNVTLGSLPQQWAIKWPERTALVDSQKSLTFYELEEEVKRLASFWSAHGLKSGDRIVLQLPNCIEFATALFSCMRVGIIPILALPAHRIKEIQHMLKLSEACAYIIGGDDPQNDYLGMANLALQSNPSLKHIFTANPIRDYKCIYDDHDNSICAETFDVDPCEVAFMLLSGGTTGMPKLIPRTHNDYYYNITGSNDICKVSALTVYMSSIPVAHNFSLGCPGMLGVLEMGGKVVLAPSPDPITGIEWIEKEKVTITAIVPTLAGTWIDAIELMQPDLDSLKILQVGGSKLDTPMAKKVRKSFGCTLQQVFGMAEGLLNYTRVDDSIELIEQTQGRPMSPLDEILIVDSSGNKVAEGEKGELWTRGPYTIKGYYAVPEYNAVTFTQDGYYKSGDIVSQLPSGHLIVHGRSKEVVKRGGEAISLDEIRQSIELHDNVRQAAVVLINDLNGNEQLYAVVETTGNPLSLEKLREFLMEQGMAVYKIPSRLKVLPKLPLTSVGKTDVNKIKELILENKKI